MSELRINILTGEGQVGFPYLGRLPRPTIVPLGALGSFVRSFGSGKLGGQTGEGFDATTDTGLALGTLTPFQIETLQDAAKATDLVMPCELRWYDGGAVNQLILDKPEPMVRLNARVDMKMDKADRARYRGTVKQGAVLDYSLSLTCRLQTGSGKIGIPEEQLSKLKLMLERSQAAELYCALTSLFAITEVVITNVSLDPIAGAGGAFELKLEMLSDDLYPYTLLESRV